jgi:hypothetical protein
LQKDKKRRLGSNRENDSEEILSHPWFKGVDVIGILEKKAEPPIKPSVKSLKEIIDS